MAKKEKTTKRPKALQVDFTGVEGKKGARRIPEGDYLMEVTDYSVGHKSDDEDKKFVKVNYKILKGPTNGDWNEIFGLGKKQLWRLRNFLEAVGFKIASESINVPMEKIVGRKIAMTVEDDVYEGKTKSQVSDWFKAKDYEKLAADSDEEDEDAEDEDTEDEDEETAEEAVTADDEDEDEELEIDDDDI